ncbi:MAG: sensor histidine kinase [Lachnospiraceae bacterium]|nr:sensor histidine kinase [Lachnospiraceae bacterium]
MSLAQKIRYSYLIVVLPLLIFLIILIGSLQRQNRQYDELIEAAGRASSFSLSFKSDFDYETYLVIVESKTFNQSRLFEMLDEAGAVVSELEKDKNMSEDNKKRLEDISKYLENLRTYTERIRANLYEGGKYEDNILIWENDVQIVTALVRESIIQFIYYEIQDLNNVRQTMREVYMQSITSLVVALVAVMILVVMLSYRVSQTITSPVRKLSEVTRAVTGGDLSVRANIESGSEIGVLGKSLDEMIERINTLLNEVKIEQESLRKAELELLQEQINPHFLYNTLDTIVWLAEGGDQERVVGMVESLSDFFRASLGQGRDVVTLSEELKHVSSYLEIQQVRYQDILTYSIDVPEEIHDTTLPKITLQPLVENALYHGIKNKRGGGSIKITGEKETGVAYVYIEDTGIGIDKERLSQIAERLGSDYEEDSEGTVENAAKDKSGRSGDIFELFNVNERIRLKSGTRYGIHIDSEYGKGTKVTVMLPLES